MTWFTVKKAFFDAWDGFMAVVLVNLGFIASVALFLGPAAALDPGPPRLVLTALAVFAFELCRVASSIALAPLAEGGSTSFRAYFSAWPEALPAGLLLGAADLALWAAVRAAVPFYLGLGGVVGSFALGVSLWTSVLVFLGLQWLPAARARLKGRGLGRQLRASFAMLLDNPGFSLFVTAWDALSLAVSFFLAFTLPGAGGAAFARVEAFRLRMLKYEWIESRPEGAPRRPVPWAELLAPERERLGPRTLRNLIFPWKD